MDKALDKQGEPVAWLKNGNVEWVQYPMDMSKPIPLYTTPQTKPLSDDEIIGYACKAGLLNYVDNETPRHYWIDDRNEVENFVAFVQDMIAKSRKNCGD